MRSCKTLGTQSGAAVRLRPLALDDLAVMAGWDRDPEIVALMGQKFGSQDSAAEWYHRLRSGRSCRALAIETDDGRLIGEVELDRIDWRGGCAELRICIGEKDCWGHGYGRDALHTFLHLAFDAWRLRSVYLRVYADNGRAIRLYRRLGFMPQGLLPPSRRRDDPGGVLLMNLSRGRFLRLEREAASD